MKFENIQQNLNKISAFVIILSAFLIGIETSFRDEENLKVIFRITDILIFIYFSLEIIFRIFSSKSSVSDFFKTIISKVKVESNVVEKEKENDIIEEWLWIAFDFSLVVLSLLSFLRHFLEHPQLVLILRLFGVFRIFRVFELNDTLKRIERKIISVIPTILTFFFLIALMIYTYSIVGMHLYNYEKFQYIDFSNLYSSMTSLFILMTNGWSNVLFELRQVDHVAILVTDVYVISFFIFSVLITLNVFLAVMTSQIEEKLTDDLKKMKESDEEIKSEIIKLDQIDKIENEVILEKMNQILKEIEQLKSKKE
jgi:hypothetical protein